MIGSSDKTVNRRAVCLTLLFASVLGVAACGRRGDPRPPEGEEANFHFPAFYPNPEETLSPRREEVEEADAEGEEREAAQEFKPAVGQPKPGYRFEGDGYSRSRSLTY